MSNVLVLRARRASRAAAGAASTIGVLVLIGWAFGIPVLKSIWPTWVAMRPNAALCFIPAGISLLLLLRDHPTRATDNVAYALAAFVTAVGALTLFEYITGVNLGIDQVLNTEPPGTALSVFPGRMAIQAAAGFALIGSATLLFRRQNVRYSQTLALLTASVGALGFAGYVFDSTVLVRWGPTATAAHATVGLLALAAAVLLGQAGRGAMEFVTTDGADGVMVRRLLPAVLAAPFVLGGAAHWAVVGGLLPDIGVGWALFALAMVLTQLFFLGWSARDVGRAHQRVESQVTERTADLTRANAQLEEEIRERKLAEVALRKEESALADVVRELDAFNYSVSHDLRAPLRSLDGFSLAVLEDYGDRLDAEGRRDLERIRAAARKMGELIDALLKLSRLSRAELHLTQEDLSVLAREIADDLAEAEPSRHVEFTIQPELYALADGSLMRSLLENLLGNAFKFTAHEEPAHIEFGAQDLDGERAYFVRDDGAGFDMTYADKLFEAFQRLHTERDFPGLGIGLATVARIVRRHGGRVWAEGEPGCGATFYFTLGEDGDEKSG